jgi:hypothetical protein
MAFRQLAKRRPGSKPTSAKYVMPQIGHLGNRLQQREVIDAILGLLAATNARACSSI